MKHSNSDIISLHVYNNSPYQITLPLGLLGYRETNATKEIINRVNNVLQLLDTILSLMKNYEEDNSDEVLSINIIMSNEKRITD